MVHLFIMCVKAQYICLHDLVYQFQTGKHDVNNELTDDSPVEEKPPENIKMVNIDIIVTI